MTVNGQVLQIGSGMAPGVAQVAATSEAPAVTSVTSKVRTDASWSGWLTSSLALGCFVNMVSTLALAPFLPSIAAELGVSVALVGQIPSLTMLLAAMLGLVAGPLGDHFGYRRSTVIGLATSAVSTLGIALAPGLLPL